MLIQFTFLCLMSEYDTELLKGGHFVTMGHFDCLHCAGMELLYCAYLSAFVQAWGPAETWAKPKHHHAMHIPYEIWLFGPAIYYWCMRYEVGTWMLHQFELRPSHCLD